MLPSIQVVIAFSGKRGIRLNFYGYIDGCGYDGVGGVDSDVDVDVDIFV